MGDEDAPVSSKMASEESTVSGSVPTAAAHATEPGNASENNGARRNLKHSDRGNDKRGKKRKNGGFGSHKQDPGDRRERAGSSRLDKRRKVIEGEANGDSYMSINFTPEEIAAEERRPKRKVAVMIGYAGSGYSGLQMNHKEKTIEGDLFSAFVAAGAISKANADDPKKSSFVRCARTDKGVHAAGNVLSLKLIIEDEDIVERINEHLPQQIRVWGVQRTNNGFSSYQACDSRWYEYLMPSYALLPPRPTSFLGRKVIESAKEKGVYDEYMGRLDDVRGFWESVEKDDIQPILEALGPEIRSKVVEMTQGAQTEGSGVGEVAETPVAETPDCTEDVERQPRPATVKGETAGNAAGAQGTGGEGLSPVDSAVKEVKAAYVAAKRRYRATPARLGKLQEALNLYLGTNNFHNYTILKTHADPSAKRHIKSFVVNPTPVQIRDTEWLSIKVHGQSFMMHQIRKMIAMAVMAVRCGAPLDIIKESYGPRRISIPKAPGLGLMLERPQFVEYNKRATEQLGREPIDFSRYEDKIQEFKDKEIYSRMFEAEEKENAFHTFFNQLDNFRTDYFLWVTAGGLEAAYERTDRGGEKIPRALQAELGDDADGVEETVKSSVSMAE